MIGRSGLFADIMCPFEEDGCSRPHCHFWHSKDDIAQQGSTAVASTSTGPQQQFVGYVGYVEADPTSVGGYRASMYAPSDPSFSSYNPSCPTEAGYVASYASSTANHISSSANAKPTKITGKRSSSPLESLSKPKVPVEIPVDEVLDPSQDILEAKKKEKKNDVSCKTELMQTPKHLRAKKLNDYVKSVADIDTRIEELQKAIEREKKEKEKIVHEFRATVKPSSSTEYMPIKKSVLKKSDEHASCPTFAQTTRSGSYSGGYIPTPIAVLKSSAKKKEKIRKESEKDGSGSDSTVAAKPLRPKIKPDKCVSIEDLFEDDPPPVKKKRVAKAVEEEKEQVAQKKPKQDLTDEQVETAKKRMAEVAAAQSAARLRPGPPKNRAPNVAQQLVSRYEKLQKEKAEIMKRVQEKATQKVSKSKTTEEEFDYRAGAVASSVGKGETRKAHSINISKAAAMKVMPLDPCSSSKIPHALRIRYVELFHTECLKFCDSPLDAAQQAQQEEKAIKDRAVTKGGYTSAAVNVLRRLRELAAGVSPSASKVSHEAVLAGKHYGSVTLGKRKYSAHGTQSISEKEFYEALCSKYLLTKEQLESNGYPIWENEEKTKVKMVISERDQKKKMFVDESDLKRICCRCGAEFRLTPKGEYAVKEQCIHHWGRAYNTKTRGNWESRYSCCSSDLTVKGCCVADYHVTDTLTKSELLNFRETPSPSGASDPRSLKVYALDCEMVYTAKGLSLARISVVDMNDDLVLDVLVRPKYTVLDYNTRFSGLTQEQLENAENDFEQALERLFELVNSESILIGHSLESDLKAMRIVHHKVVDTSVVYPHRLGPPYKRALKTIASDVLQLIIQEDVSGHDSKEDSSACMRLMLHKVKHD